MSAISVVVPSRNRPDHAEACVQSILRNDGDFELVLVDQSDSDATERALRNAVSDRRFTLVRTTTRGASNARNVGISATKHPLIAFTDDDCRVAKDWLANILAVFDSDPQADLVYGRVYVPDALKGKGFAADFEPDEREYVGRFPPVDVPWGIGANMSARRALFSRLGVFDPLLGPGAPFNAGEEFDLMIRALAAGAKVVNAAEIQVEHLGVREGDDASVLMRGYGVSVGATLAKHVRLRTQGSDALIGRWVSHFAWRGARNVLSGVRPSGVGLVLGMLRGVYLSSKFPVDQQHSVYTPRG